jgi:hypothetical protein
MRSIREIGAAIEAVDPALDPRAAANELLYLAEAVLEHWVEARGEEPTLEAREGFRLLALHRQGAKGEPSFNACRETCREVCYYYNLVTLQPAHAEITHRSQLMQMVSNHLYLFISGKLEVAGLGEFCCSSKPIRLASQADASTHKEA